MIKWERYTLALLAMAACDLHMVALTTACVVIILLEVIDGTK